MTLAEYLKKNELSDLQFGRLIGRDRTTILRWRKGERFPDPAGLRDIFSITLGKVSANDFYHGARSESLPA